MSDTEKDLKTWAKGVERAWKDIAKDSSNIALDVISEKADDSLDPSQAEAVYQNVLGEVETFDAFMRAWIEDAKINKGMWVRAPDKSPRGEGLIKTIEKALVAFREMLTVIEDTKTKLKYDIAGFDSDSDRDFDPKTRGTSGYEFRMRGMGHRLKDLVSELTKTVAKVTKLISTLPDRGGYIPSELDLHGAKIVFEDSKNVVPTKDPEKDTHPMNRNVALEAVNAAYELITRKGLGFLWYGNIFFKPSGVAMSWKGQTGTNYTEGAHYDIRQDHLMVFLKSGSDAARYARFIAHEMGHRYWYKYMDIADRAEFADRFLAPGTEKQEGDDKVPAVTEYGGNDPEEDFAEIFAHYIDGEDMSQQQLERFRRHVEQHRRKVASPSLTFRQDHRGHHGGQDDFTIYAFNGAQRVGYVDYTVFNGVYTISMVEVLPLAKGQGVGPALMHELAREADGWKNVDPAYMTDEGVKLFEKMDKELGSHWQPPKEIDHEALVREYGGNVKKTTPSSLGDDVELYVEFDDPEKAKTYADDVAGRYELRYEPDIQEMDGKAWVDVTLPRTARVAASQWDLDDALDELAAPIRLWIHRPDSEGKRDIAEVYESLSPSAKAALAADVRRVSPAPFSAYRRIKGGSETLKGLDSVTTDKSRVEHADYREYLIDPDDVLVHWQQDTPLGKGNFAHEQEVILKPGVSIAPSKKLAVFEVVAVEDPALDSARSDVLSRSPADIVTFPWDAALQAQLNVFEGICREAMNLDDPGDLLANAASQLHSWIRTIEVTPFQWDYHGADIDTVKAMFVDAKDAVTDGDVEEALALVQKAYALVFGSAPRKASIKHADDAYRLDDIYLMPNYPHEVTFRNTTEEPATAVVADILKRRPQLRGFLTEINVRNDDPVVQTVMPHYHGDEILIPPGFYDLPMNKQEETFTQAVGMLVGERWGWDNVVIAARDASIDPWDKEKLPFGFKTAFAYAFAMELLYPGYLEDQPKWQRLVNTTLRTVTSTETQASTHEAATLTPEWAQKKFIEFTKSIWSEKTYNEYLKTRIVFSDDPPSQGVLASVTSSGVQRAIGDSLVQVAPKYTVRFAPRLFDLPEAKAEGFLKHEVIHLGYPRHDADFRYLAKEVGAPLTENDSDGGGVRLEVKEGARYKVVQQFETEGEARKFWRTIKDDPSHELHGKKFRITV